MTRAVAGAVLWVAVTATGCGSSTNALDYCREGIAAICSRLFDCDPVGAGQRFGSQTSCENQTAGQCSTATCTSGKTFDQSAADQCLSAYNSASCGALEQGVHPQVCSQVCK